MIVVRSKRGNLRDVNNSVNVYQIAIAILLTVVFIFLSTVTRFINLLNETPYDF